jgi:hypothetical protein
MRKDNWAFDTRKEVHVEFEFALRDALAALTSRGDTTVWSIADRIAELLDVPHEGITVGDAPVFPLLYDCEALAVDRGWAHQPHKYCGRRPLRAESR